MLQTLNLSRNKLDTIPESIGDLKSLQILNLNSNELTKLPNSIWKLHKLNYIKLFFNPWDEEWKEIVKRDAPAIREFCRHRVTINIFISHTVAEFKSYRIKDLAEYLEKQSEINQVYFCEEDLKGNIDMWMEETVPKSQLLLFIGTQKSIFDSKDCAFELFLARKYDIEIIPIKGVNVSWEDLAKVGLSRKLGFEYSDKDFQKFSTDLYRYIREYKRNKDLVTKK